MLLLCGAFLETGITINIGVQGFTLLCHMYYFLYICIMIPKEQNNGNTQLNKERESFNDRVNRFSVLGKTKKVQWDASRRHRNI
jgi:hypothetical protein